MPKKPSGDTYCTHWIFTVSNDCHYFEKLLLFKLHGEKNFLLKPWGGLTPINPPFATPLYAANIKTTVWILCSRIISKNDRNLFVLLSMTSIVRRFHWDRAYATVFLYSHSDLYSEWCHESLASYLEVSFNRLKSRKNKHYSRATRNICKVLDSERDEVRVWKSSRLLCRNVHVYAFSEWRGFGVILLRKMWILPKYPVDRSAAASAAYCWEWNPNAAQRAPAR